MDTRFDDRWLAAHPADRRLAALLADRHGHLDEDQLAGVRLQLEARSHHDVWDRLGAISCPTLVAAGRYDGIAPVANSRALASRIPEAQLRVFEGGHGFIAQDPDSLPAIIGFLAAGPPGQESDGAGR
jgi:3-oxoadipate enol-lactonase